MRRLFIILTTLIGLCVGVFAYSPYLAAQNFQKSLHEGDVSQIEETTDFVRVRQSLSAQISPKPSSDDSFLAKLGKGLVGGFTDAVIDSMVTPEGLSFLMAGDVESSKTGKNQGSTKQFKTEVGFRSLTTFEIKTFKNKNEHVLSFILEPDGLNWKVVAIDLSPILV